MSLRGESCHQETNFSAVFADLLGLAKFPARHSGDAVRRKSVLTGPENGIRRILALRNMFFDRQKLVRGKSQKQCRCGYLQKCVLCRLK